MRAPVGRVKTVSSIPPPGMFIHSRGGDMGGSAQHMGPPTAAQCAGSQVDAWRRYDLFFYGSSTVIGLSRGAHSDTYIGASVFTNNSI